MSNLEYLKVTTDPEEELKKKFMDDMTKKDPYTICDWLEKTGGVLFGKSILNILEDAIIETHDIVQIYEFLFMAVDMKVKGFNRERFERIIRDSGNAKLMCYCIGFVSGIDVNAMIEQLYKTNNAYYIEQLSSEEYKEILDIRELDSEYDIKLQNAKKAEYFPKSLSDFKQLKHDIESLITTIIKTGNPYLITEMANYVEYLNKYKNGNYVLDKLTQKQIELKDPMNLYEYLSSVPSLKDKMPLIDVLTSLRKKKFIRYTLEYVPGLNEEEMKKLDDSLECLNKG